MVLAFKPTCDIADILKNDTLSIDIQFKNYGVKDAVAGSIRTIHCFQDNLLVKQILNSPGNDQILVIDGAASVHTALVGDLIAGAAVNNGWAGIIVNAAVRDSAELAELPIHIKALGTNPRKSAQQGSGTVDVPITLAGITVEPGDWLFSDNDGVVIVKNEQKALIVSTNFL